MFRSVGREVEGWRDEDNKVSCGGRGQGRSWEEDKDKDKGSPRGAMRVIEE